MTDPTPKIDTSGIDALRQIKKDQDVLNDRLEKMNEKKGKVSEAVFEKVLQDYQTKQDALNAQANPLKEQVRGQYRVLKSLMDELKSEMDNVSLQKEELEFRNELGEFEDGFFKEEIEKVDLELTQKQAEMDEADQMKALFVAVFDSEEDLESGMDEPEEPQAAEEPVEAEADEVEEASEPLEPDPEEPVEEMAAELESEPEPEPEPELDSEPEADSEADTEESPGANLSEMETDALSVVETELDEDVSLEELGEPLEDNVSDVMGELSEDDLPTDLDELDAEDLDGEYEETDSIAPPPLPPEAPAHGAPEPPSMGGEDATDSGIQPPPLPMGEAPVLPGEQLAAGQGEDDPDGTMIISNPKIISLNNAIEGQVVVLGMGTTSIGRSPDNDIHLTEDRISRKHSQIAFGPGGYALYDLNSENGTYVNGNRIREHFLSDGDIVMVGTYKFLYRDH